MDKRKKYIAISDKLLSIQGEMEKNNSVSHPKLDLIIDLLNTILSLINNQQRSK